MRQEHRPKPRQDRKESIRAAFAHFCAQHKITGWLGFAFIERAEGQPAAEVARVRALAPGISPIGVIGYASAMAFGSGREDTIPYEIEAITELMLHNGEGFRARLAEAQAQTG